MVLLFYLGGAVYDIQTHCKLEHRYGIFVLLILFKGFLLLVGLNVIGVRAENYDGLTLIVAAISGLLAILTVYLWNRDIARIEKAGFVAFAYSGKGFVSVLTSVSAAGLAILLGVSFCFAGCPVSFEKVSTVNSRSEAYQHALDLGIPEDIVQDLDEYMLAEIEDGTELKTQENTTDGITVRTMAVKSTNPDETESDEWTVIQYVNWPDTTRFYGTNYITQQTKENYTSLNDDAFFSATVLYDDGDITYGEYPTPLYHINDGDGYKLMNGTYYSMPNHKQNYRGYFVFKFYSMSGASEYAETITTNYYFQKLPCFPYENPEQKLEDHSLVNSLSFSHVEETFTVEVK